MASTSTEFQKRRILYIVCPGRSGSTLLTLLLATHPEIATIGERMYLHHRLGLRGRPYNLCACGKHIPDCEFCLELDRVARSQLGWYQKKVNYAMFQYSRRQWLNRRLRRLTKRSDHGRRGGLIGRLAAAPYRRLLDANEAVVERVLESKGASVFLDGSKLTADLESVAAGDRFDIQLIHLSRDGRGHFHSVLRARPHYSETRNAEMFRNETFRIHELISEWPRPTIRLKYEDLCADPAGELRRVISEAGLDPDGVSLDFRSADTHAIGNAGVMTADSSRIVDRQLWRDELSDDQLELFERIAGEANRSLGYAA